MKADLRSDSTSQNEHEIPDQEVASSRRVSISAARQLQGFQEQNSPTLSYHISISAGILVAMEMVSQHHNALQK